MQSGIPRTFVGSTTFNVVGIRCRRCQNAVVQAVATVTGVESVIVDPASGMVTVTVGRAVDRADIAAAIGRAGYTVGS